jgi:hypothetical protein
MFPISVEGTIDVPVEGAKAALDRLRIAVTAIGAKSVEQLPDGLIFHGNWPLAIKPTPIAAFDRCEISVETGQIKYNCSTIYLLVWTSTLTIAFWLLVLLSQPKLSVALSVVPVWLLMFGGNYLFYLLRMRNFLSAVVCDDKEILSNDRTFRPRFTPR